MHLAPPSPQAYLNGLEHVGVFADTIAGLVMEVSARKVLPLSVSAFDRENDASDDRNRLDILQAAASGKLHLAAFDAPEQTSRLLQDCRNGHARVHSGRFLLPDTLRRRTQEGLFWLVGAMYHRLSPVLLPFDHSR